MNGDKYNPEWILGTDGSHSIVRQLLGLGFEGSSIKETWYLADVPLKTYMQYDSGHMHFSNKGFRFFLRVVEDIRKEQDSNESEWRVLGNFPDILSNLPEGTTAGKFIWQSQFHISHRIASHFQVGMYFWQVMRHIFTRLWVHVA